jgi:3-hydroxyacyl-CoA dehydrogenase
MNRNHLIHEAKREVLHLAESGSSPALPEKIYAAGRDALAALRIGLNLFEESRQISPHDRLVGEKLASVLCGGELSQPAWVEEQYILDLEREAFLSLCGETLSQARIWHTLETGKPLRN